MTDISHDRLLIIDFGSQVTQLIARRLRELNVFCEIKPFNTVDDAYLEEFAPKAVIFSGGPSSVFAEGAPMPPQSVFELGVPILGICYGQQVMMHCLGGKVVRGHGTAEFGRAFVTPSQEKLPLLQNSDWRTLSCRIGQECTWMCSEEATGRFGRDDDELADAYPGHCNRAGAGR